MNIKIKLLLLTILFSTLQIVAQTKLKGNKIVVTQNRDVSSFTSIDVMDDIDVYLFQGSNPYLNVEADENLQEAIKTQVEGSTLKIYLSEKIKSSKKLNIVLTVTDSLKAITARSNSNIYADSRLILRELTVNAYENADLILKLDADNFTVNALKNTDLKFDVFSINLNANTSESTELKLEGEIENLNANVKDNSIITVKGKGEKIIVNALKNGTFKGKDFKVNEANITATSRTDLYINVKDKVSITANDKAEISIYNKPEIELLQFDDKVKLHKKN